MDKQIIVLESDARNGKLFLPATTRCIIMSIRGTYVQLRVKQLLLCMGPAVYGVRVLHVQIYMT